MSEQSNFPSRQNKNNHALLSETGQPRASKQSFLPARGLHTWTQHRGEVVQSRLRRYLAKCDGFRDTADATPSWREINVADTGQVGTMHHN